MTSEPNTHVVLGRHLEVESRAAADADDPFDELGAVPGAMRVVLGVAATVAGLALAADWRVALLVAAVIVAHELGNPFALRREGVENRLAGPVLGGVATLALLVTAEVAGSQVLGRAAWLCILVHLANVAPLRPHDGGGVLAGVRLSGWVAVACSLVALALWHPLGWALSIAAGLALAALDGRLIWLRLRHPAAGDAEIDGSYARSLRRWLATACCYAVVVAVLAATPPLVHSFA